MTGPSQTRKKWSSQEFSSAIGIRRERSRSFVEEQQQAAPHPPPEEGWDAAC